MNEAEFRRALGRSMGEGPEADPAQEDRAWNWRTLDAVAAEFALDELAGWVDWLATRYDIADQIPGCWAAHGWAVEELSALYFAWLAAYDDPDARAEGPLDWAESFDRARARLREWDRYGCASGIHRAGPQHLEALRRAESRAGE